MGKLFAYARKKGCKDASGSESEMPRLGCLKVENFSRKKAFGNSTSVFA